MVVLPILNPNIPYDAAKDFAPVVHFGSAANVLVVNKDVPANSVQELIALAKAKPGTLTFASQGIGSSAHMAAEQFRLAAGIDIVHVPYRGSAPAVTDLIGGQVNMMFDNVTFALPQVRGGKVRALGITADKRVGVLPDVPTMAEAGLPDVEGGVWFTLFAPAGTPRAVIAYLNKQAREIFSRRTCASASSRRASCCRSGRRKSSALSIAEDATLGRRDPARRHQVPRCQRPPRA